MSRKLFVLAFTFFISLIGFGQTKLPYFEGFENIGTTTTFTSNATSINGLSGWSYENTNRGRVRFKLGSAYSYNGTASASLDVSRNNSTSTNYLILTLDLSNYKSSELELSFKYQDHGDESNTTDRVWVRATTSDTWVEIYNWYSNRATAGTWKLVEGLDIDKTLASASQTVGSTFQVRFGQTDNFQTRSTTADDGVSFDDIEIVERLNRDGQILEFRNYCSGTSSIQALIFNDGLDTIKTAQVDWWINGNKQKGYNYSGSILPGATSLLTLGTTSFSSGNNIIEAVFDSINGALDQSINDTLKVNQGPGLSGNYTVGGSGADFSSFADVVNALNQRGVCGAVNVKLNSGTYSGSNTLGPIDGLSKTNTLTFDGEDSSKTIITHNASTNRTTLTLEAIRWVTFKNLKIESTGSSNAWGVHLTNACRNIAFENCFINLSTSGTTQNVFGIVASASPTSESASGDNIAGLTIKDSRFVGGERSVQLMGPLTNYSSGFDIYNNIFVSNYYSSLGLYNLQNIDVRGNNMSTFRDNGANAIVAYDIDNFKIEQNYILSRNYGVYAQDVNLNANSASSFINNIISTGGHGVYFNNARILNVQHNTIVGSPAIRFNSYSGVDLRNNILYGNGGYAFYCPAANGFSELNWNHYYSTATNKYFYDNINYGSLNAWQNANTILNPNSFEGAPSILSTANPYLSTSKIAERAADIGISIDIDGETRCDIAPSIGADESKYKDPKPSTSFSINDSSFVNAIVQAKNGSSAEKLLYHEWFINSVLVDSGNLNLNYQFGASGRYKVTLKSSNCGSFDTTSKFIVINPVSKPVIPRFNASKTSISVGEKITLLNKSINGPDTINWKISPYFDGKKTRTFQYTDGTDSSSFEPVIYFTTPGDYTICLYASNKLGGSTKCKIDLVTVIDEAEMCSSTSSTVTEGVIRDPGGVGNYRGLQRYNCNFTIAPCAKNLKLTFTEFDLTNNRDYLKIYDGTDNSGTALHSYNSAYNNGLTGDDQASSFQKTLTAKSGKAYLEFTTNWFFGAPGFEMEWSSTPLNAAPPTANFDIPDTICLGTDLNIENKSSGQGNNYSWDISSPVTNTVEYTDSAVNHFFFFAGKYTVTLIVKNCGGSDTVTKKIVVVEPTAKPTAKMAIDIPNPDKGQVVTLTDVSTLKGYLCSEYRTWRITPTSKFSYATGYGSQNQITKVTFSDTGCYDIRLIASNSNGIDTVLVKCAVRVIERCVPKVTNLDEDIGIARVQLEDINNVSPAGITAYSDFRADHRTELQKGANYTIDIYRDKGPQSDINRAVWIDYNQDGDFTDKGELVAKSASAVKNVLESFDFRVPQTAKMGSTTMRVGVSKNNSSNTPCGTNVNGEFEDYLVILVDDYEAPKITLYGSLTDTIEQCGTWTDPKGFAIDNGLRDTLALTILDTLNTSIVGTQLIRYAAIDSNFNADTVLRKVVVLLDKTNPTISLKGSDSVYVEVKTSYTELGYDTDDNCSGVLDSVNCNYNLNTLGAYKCVYYAYDAAGNVATVTRNIYVGDKTAPTLRNLIGGDTIKHQINTAYVDQGATFIDNYNDSADIEFLVKGSVDTTTAGEYEIWYIATDKSGNRDSVMRLVIVADFLTPKVVLIGNGEITIDVFTTYTDQEVTYTNYDGGTSGLTLTVTGTYVDSFGYNKQATLVGSFTLIYTVENATGGKTEITRTIYVVDREAPVITLLGNNPLLLKQNDDFIEPGWTVNDNYWGTDAVWVYNYGTVNTLVPDTYYVNYYAADSSANVSADVVRMVIVDEPIGINESDWENINVYPNPTNGLVNIQVLGNEQNLSISIIDMLGRTLDLPLRVQNGILSFDLSEQRDGNYLILINGNFGTKRTIVVKQ